MGGEEEEEPKQSNLIKFMLTTSLSTTKSQNPPKNQRQISSETTLDHSKVVFGPLLCRRTLFSQNHPHNGPILKNRLIHPFSKVYYCVVLFLSLGCAPVCNVL